MARRIVTHTRVHHGKVIALCNPDEWWSPRSVTDIIIDIQRQAHTYHVLGIDDRLTRVAMGGNTLQVIALDPDGIDLLTTLPRC